MESLNPKILVESLKTFGKAFAVRRSNWRRLRLFLIGLFLLHLALTAVMVKLASQHVNLASMRPFFEIAVNSTTTRVEAVALPNEGTEASLPRPPRFLRNVELRDLFTTMSIIAVIISFTYTCNLPGQHPARFTISLAWRELKSWCFLLINGMGMFIFTSAAVDDLHLSKPVSGHFEYFFQFVFLLSIVVAYKEDLNVFSAAERACSLAGKRFYGIFVLGTMTFVVRDILNDIYAYVGGKYLIRYGREETPVTRKNTAAEIVLFSIAAALLTLVLHVFQCSVILAFYDEGRLAEEQLGDGNENPRPHAD